MTRTTILLALVLSLVLATAAVAQNGFGPGDGTGECNFIDEDGDGFNDLAPDADGDGIPNGLDPDYVRPEDGSGMAWRHGQADDALAKMFAARSFAGETFGVKGLGNGQGAGNGYGPGDGTGTGSGPGDGTGFGPGDGTGDCDGTGLIDDAARSQRGGRR